MTVGSILGIFLVLCYAVGEVLHVGAVLVRESGMPVVTTLGIYMLPSPCSIFYY